MSLIYSRSIFSKSYFDIRISFHGPNSFIPTLHFHFLNIIILKNFTSLTFNPPSFLDLHKFPQLVHAFFYRPPPSYKISSLSKINLLSGLKIGSKKVDVSFLQYADATLFFCEDSWSNVVNMKAILKINFHKSILVGINFENTTLSCYSKILNCGLMGYPFKYLGLEVGGNPGKKAFWEPVLTNLKSRLSAWKGRFLSLAGRSCVIKFVLTVVPLFYLSVFKASESVYKSIICTQRRFLWGWGKENKPISWVSRGDVCKQKEEGGLGIKDIRKLNCAMLAKWRWRLISQEKGKWKEVLLSKYGFQQEG